MKQKYNYSRDIKAPKGKLAAVEVAIIALASTVAYIVTKSLKEMENRFGW